MASKDLLLARHETESRESSHRSNSFFRAAMLRYNRKDKIEMGKRRKETVVKKGRDERKRKKEEVVSLNEE